ncbi:MAG: hypothetical protein E5X44_30465, partial [Mesorhizobium sp.]
TLDRLHQKGLIANPANKAKSVILTDEGLRRAEELFRTLSRGRRHERWAGVPIPRQESRSAHRARAAVAMVLGDFLRQVWAERHP